MQRSLSNSKYSRCSILSYIALLFLTVLPVSAQDFEKGLSAAKTGDYVSAFNELTPLAESGNVQAQRILGLLYSRGDGVEKNLPEAFKWWQRAAAKGDAVAQFSLGRMYHYGQGITKDPSEALRWYRLSADQGNSWAQGTLGIIYETGDGVPQNFVEAIKWLRLAADQGEVIAQKRLGILYGSGKGPTLSYPIAIEWLTRAALNGATDANEKLINIIEEGDNVPYKFLMPVFLGSQLIQGEICLKDKSITAFSKDSITTGMKIIDEMYSTQPLNGSNATQQLFAATVEVFRKKTDMEDDPITCSLSTFFFMGLAAKDLLDI